ncbi:MAG: metal-dependent hydrolase, partial [Pyrinomonadaceae bacterium]
GLERLSPYATTVCVVSANIADADFVALFAGDRWTLLQHHRGITHSILGTLASGLLVPLLAFAIERVVVKVRKRSPQIRLSGLLIASLIASATHPILDWTNNYGVRPWLPWSGRWFYGDLVFIFDPYIWLALGSVVFLLTSKSRTKTLGWSLLGLAVLLFLGLAAWRSGPGGAAIRIALAAWSVAVVSLVTLRLRGIHKQTGRATAMAALALLVMYWGVLAVAHRFALMNTQAVAARLAAANGERALRSITMPTAANPFQWQSVTETDLAMYRFKVGLGDDPANPSPANAAIRFEKPTGQSAQLVSIAKHDRRTQILLGFARFPIAQVDTDNCIGQALGQFADLRYTEPGTARGNFSVNIPVDCPTR